MLDPISALSVAGNIVQFVDFGSKVISKSRQLYSNGGTEDHAQASRWIADLERYSKKLRETLSAVNDSLTENETSLMKICQDCEELATSMIKSLGKVTLPPKRKLRLLYSVKVGVEAAWKADELKGMLDMLSRYREAINTHMLQSLSDRIDLSSVEQSARFERLDDANKEILRALLNPKSASGSPQQRIAALATFLDRAEDSTTGEERVVRERVKRQILESLTFQAITERFEDVTEAHESTCQYIFQEPKNFPCSLEKKHWSNFREWLQHGKGLYWINGKAGAGKSTLMKYIFTSPLTKQLLSSWCPSSSNLLTAEFFFWNSGSRLQKSQAGLLRSLLHDILRQNPALIPLVLPQQWAERYIDETQELSSRQWARQEEHGSSHSRLNDSLRRPVSSWLLRDLKLAFSTLFSESTLNAKVCLFIDGLDEYEGDDDDIANLFSSAAKSMNVKICVSSRPHQAFYDAFQNQPCMRIQDLTFPDICKFVDDRLAKNERLQQMAVDHELVVNKLTSDVSLLADGVFLWVNLVVQSLVQGLRNHDNIAFLTKRLYELPRDLDNLYNHMIFNVDKDSSVYQSDRSKLFQLLDCATTSRPGDWIPEPGGLTVLTTFLATQHNALQLALSEEPSSWPYSQLQCHCQEVEIAIRTRCGGLLEVQHESLELGVSPDMRVTYLHMTVTDFLKLQGTRVRLDNSTRGEESIGFLPNAALLFAYVARLKIAVTSDEDPASIWKLMDRVILYARRTEADTQTGYVELLDGFFKAISAWWTWTRSHSSNRAFYTVHTSMVSLAARCGLYHYLRLKLSQEFLATLDFGGKSLLYYAVTPQAPGSISSEVVRLLLEYGVDPNRRERLPGSDERTCWQHCVASRSEARSFLQEWETVTMLMLKYGARSECIIEVPTLSHFRASLPQESDAQDRVTLQDF